LQTERLVWLAESLAEHSETLVRAAERLELQEELAF
jgi:hypothetical protein